MTDPADLCTAVHWDGQPPPMFCSLPAHTRGMHAAHRGHDPKDVPPILKWPFKRDDSEAYTAHQAEVARLAGLSESALRDEANISFMQKTNVMLGKRKPSADIERRSRLIADERARRLFS